MAEIDLSSTLEEIHKKMEKKYMNNKSVIRDKKRAADMEKYLYSFKVAGSRALTSSEKKSIVKELDLEVMDNLAQEVGNKLGIDRYQLFQNKHNWYNSNKKGETNKNKWGTDDVFESELTAFLQVAIDKFIEKGQNFKDPDVLTKVMGNVSEKTLGYLEENIQKKVEEDFNSTGHEFTTKPTSRAIKTDVKSFKGTYQIKADVDKKWKNFIDTFKNAKFTVKNYVSNPKYSIHLGSTEVQKSIPAALQNIGYGEKKSVQLFYYLSDNNKKDDEEVKNHIIHLRSAYELAGGGLYTRNNDGTFTKLEETDFFIWNDSTSEKIYVRSTKAMIAELLDPKVDSLFAGIHKDPLKSDITLLKTKFGN